jgi:fibronectin type 3 domain-containing protein
MPLSPPQRHAPLRAVWLVVVLTLLGAAFAVPARADEDSETDIFSADCLYSHTANDDPVVFPGMPGAAHSHEFSGSWTTNFATTTDSLTASGTTCDPAADKSGYWEPTLFLKGQRLPIEHTTAYLSKGLKNSPEQRAAIQPFPLGLRMIADIKNSPEAISGLPSGGWNCGSDPIHDGYTSSLKITWHCPDGLQSRVVFPDCWDGVNLDTVTAVGTPAVNPVTHVTYPNDHRSHMAYALRAPADGLGKGDCPRDHPVPVPEMHFKTNYFTKGLVDSKATRPNGKAGGDPVLPDEGTTSSDFTVAAGLGTPGDPIRTTGDINTFHADFWNGWDPATLKSLIDYCIIGQNAHLDTEPCLHPTHSKQDQAAIDSQRRNPDSPNACPTSCKIPVADGTPPSPPKITSTTTPGQVHLSWAANPGKDTNGIAHYIIRRDEVDIATIDGSATGYDDVGLAGGSRHAYKVKAVDPAGNVSDASNQAEVKVAAADTSAPSTPSKLTGTAISPNQVNLSWSSSSDSGGSGLSGYNVYREGTKLNVVPLTGTTFGDGTAVPGVANHYAVEAVDGAGNVSSKATVTVTTPPVGTTTTPPPPPSSDTKAPSTPKNLKAASSTGGGQVSLTWDASKDESGGSGLRGYNVYRDSGSAPLNSTPLVNTSYADSTVTAGTSYSYAVVAVDVAGNVSSKATVKITPKAFKDTKKPSTPKNLKATADGSSKVDLTWDAATDDVGVTGYVIRRDNNVIKTLGPVLKYTDTSVSKSTKYAYKVRAVDAAGNEGSDSSQAKVTTPSG